MLKQFTIRVNWGVLLCTFPFILPAQLVEQFTLIPPSANRQELSKYSNILSIEKSTKGFYVLTKKSGCFLINEQSQSSIKSIVSPDNRRDYFLDLIPNDHTVSVWANGHEIMPLNTKSDERLPYSSSYFSETVQTNSITIDKKGTVYVGTKKDGLFIFSQDEWGNYTELARRVSSFDQELPSNNIQCIYKDTNGVIWVGTDKGLASITDGKVKNLSFAERLPKSKWARFWGRPPTPPVFAEPVDAIVSWGNCVLMANENGLYKVSVIQDSLQHLSYYNFSEKLSAPLSEIKEMMVDIDGNLWIAANHLIHYNITTDKLTEVSNLHTFKGQGFLSLAEDIKNNKILIGTNRGGLYQINYQDLSLGLNW